jgi:hypothetical protein
MFPCCYVRAVTRGDHGRSGFAQWRAFPVRTRRTTLRAEQQQRREIVRYRQERGGFAAIRQLDEVPGLAGKTDGIGEFVLIGEGAPSHRSTGD